MTTINPANESDPIAFASIAPVLPEGSVQHKGTLEKISRSVEDLKKDYEKIVGQILTMTANTPTQTGLRLAAIEVELAFGAEGELGFIPIGKVKGSVDASMKLVFERK